MVIMKDRIMVGLVMECVSWFIIIYNFVFNNELILRVVRLNMFIYFLKGLFDGIKLIVLCLVRFVINL